MSPGLRQGSLLILWSNRLAGFLVVRVNPVPLAVLLHLDALAVVDLVLHRYVVATLALFTRQGDGDALVVLGHD